MKSKTKTILIFAAILAAVFLIAFLDGSAVRSDAAEEAGVLIGAYVSEEDFDLDDLIVTATGKFQWKSGRIYAEQTGKSWYFPTLDDGGGIFCAQISEEGTDYPTVVHFGGLGKARSRVTRTASAQRILTSPARSTPAAMSTGSSTSIPSIKRRMAAFI